MTLTPSIQPRIQRALNVIVEFGQTSTVSNHTIVIVVARKFGVDRCEQLWQSLMQILSTPLRKVSLRVPQFLPRRAPLQIGLSFSVYTPAKLKSEKIKTGLSCILYSVKRYDSRFLR